MYRGCILALDQGTQASRALLFSERGEGLGAWRCPVSLTRPAPFCVEQDPNELLASLLQVTRQALAEAPAPILAAGLATQRATVLAWDRNSGRPLSPALSWMDCRAEPDLERWAGHRALIRQASGLRLSPHYGASKLAWLLEQGLSVPRSREALALGPLSAFLLHHLLAHPRCRVDPANAARTLLYSPQREDWDPRLLALFGLSASLLPSLHSTRGEWGLVRDSQVPLRAVTGDQQAALLGFGAPEERALTINIGTGAFLLGVISPSKAWEVLQNEASGLLLSRLTTAEGRECWALEGTVNGAGSALAWWEEQAVARHLPQVCAPTCSSSEPLLFLNRVGGLGSPWWRGDQQALFAGGREPCCRAAGRQAVLESIVFLLCANIDAFGACGQRPQTLRVAGGGSRVEGLVQLLADCSGLPVLLSEEVELTGRGVAQLALGRAWPAPCTQCLVPRPDAALQARYRTFLRLLEQRAAPAVSPSPVAAAVAGTRLTSKAHAMPAATGWVAHRGCPARRPENTLAGFQYALEQGAHYLELDVQLSADGVPMVIHDATLERTAGARASVLETPAAQLATTSVGEPQRFGERFAAERVPTLAAVVELLNAPVSVRPLLFVELKRQSLRRFGRETMADAVIAVLAAARFPWVVISFDLPVLGYCKTQHGLPVGWALPRYDEAQMAEARKLAPEYLFLDPGLLPESRGRLPAGPWQWVLYTLNRPEYARRWRGLGAALIETDDLPRMLGVEPP